MQSDVIVNVKDISNDDVVVPDTDNDIVVPDTNANTPNTGFLGIDGNVGTNTNASYNNMLVLGVMSIAILVAIAVLVIIAKKHHIRLIFNRGKHATRLLICLAILASVFSFVGLKNLNISYNSANAEGDNNGQQGNTSTQEGSLAIDIDDAIVNIDLDDEPVFAYAKNTVTVASPTVAGYTLAAYIDGDTRDLANVTNTEAADVRIAGLESSELQALTDNTWGFALQEPDSKDSEVFSGLPTDENAPLILKTECVTTESDDETDVYIGAYVVPGLPAGTYSGVTVNYVAVANIVSDDITVDFHGNGLFFDEEQTQNENTVVYGYSSSAIDTSEQGVCGIITKSGTYMNTFNKDNSTWYSLIRKPYSSNPNVTVEFNGEDAVKDYISERHDEFEGQTMDLYATKNYTIHFEANTGEGEMADQIMSGTSRLNEATFSKDNLYFNGWNTDAGGSGTYYLDRQQVNQIAKPGQTLTLYAQWADCKRDYVCYHANGDDVVGSMDIQWIVVSPMSLLGSNFKRDGYGFAGWNTKPDYTGTFYGPNENVSTSNARPNGLNLYAVWVPSAGTMQNWDGCASLVKAPTNGTATLSSVTALTDERDGNIYTIARLADGKCWMTENLRLDNTPELSPTTTNNPSLPLTNIYDLGTTSNHLSPNSTLAYDATTAPEGWCDDWSSAACVNQSRLRTDNSTFAQGGTYSYGNYYNWYSATAGHGVYMKYSGTTAGDICPVGWHLPTGDTTGEYYALAAAVNNGSASSGANGKLIAFPASFNLSGQNQRNIINFRGSSGAYWSSTAYSIGAAFALRIGGTWSAASGNGYSTIIGASVRCVINN